MSQLRITYQQIDCSSPDDLLRYAQQLPGMTFREVLDLGIVPCGVEREYNSRRYKGGMGTLIEERFFGYKANSEQDSDFSEAQVELKATCYDVKKNGDISAGERLVLTMIPFNSPMEESFYQSHAWKKSSKILLIYYERNKQIDPYDQVIKYVSLFTPPAEDLKIIEDDYNKIKGLVQAGKAEELSESLTTYLGACTKGATAASMWTEQFYPPHTKAKKRAFCFKRQYMDYVLHAHVMGEADEAEPIVKDAAQLAHQTFEELVLAKINKHVGKTDKELCELLGMCYTGNKAQWTQITYKLLGLQGDEALEFKKANISVRTVRIEKEQRIKESLSLHNIRFMELAREQWEDSFLYNYFNETRFFFVTFQDTHEGWKLAGARFWSMPQSDIEGPVKTCWQQAKDAVLAGIKFQVIEDKHGQKVLNNLPKKRENRIAHVRPHAPKAYHQFSDGTVLGDNPTHSDVLPNGERMTKQSFWLNNTYIYGIVSSKNV